MPRIKDAAGKTALDAAKAVPPAGPGGAQPSKEVLAGRAQVVSLLEASAKR